MVLSGDSQGERSRKSFVKHYNSVEEEKHVRSMYLMTLHRVKNCPKLGVVTSKLNSEEARFIFKTQT